MEALLISAGAVGLAEIGDRTQLLALVLAARYRRPWPIAAGVLVATVANHLLAGGVGIALASVLNPHVLDWVVVGSFVAMALWMLVPEKGEGEPDLPSSALGVFGTTVIAYFLAEMGDKTQIATVALAARFHTLLPVVAGTTLGMMAANVPAILVGHRFAERLPARTLHAAAAVIFLVLGLLALRHAWMS